MAKVTGILSVERSKRLSISSDKRARSEQREERRGEERRGEERSGAERSGASFLFLLPHFSFLSSTFFHAFFRSLEVERLLKAKEH